MGIKYDNLDLNEIKKLLVTKETQEEQQKTNEMFNQMDQNNSKQVSLDDIIKCFKNMGRHIEPVLESKTILEKAFKFSFDWVKTEKKNDSNLLQKSQFIVFKVYLLKYLEICQILSQSEIDDDQDMSLEQFEQCSNEIKSQVWGFQIKNPEQVFKSLNQSDEETIPSAQFIDYVIQEHFEAELKHLKNPQEDQTQSKNKQQQNQKNEPKTEEELIKQLFPIGNTEADKKVRETFFRKFDTQKNGSLTLKDIYQGFQGLGNDYKIVLENKQCLKKAFEASKALVQSKNKANMDSVERTEFKYIIVYLRQYFEFKQLYSKMDANKDQQVSIKEFKACIPDMNKWGIHFFNPLDEFNIIDFQGDGSISFDEFVDYCIKKSLFTLQSNVREAQKVFSQNATTKDEPKNGRSISIVKKGDLAQVAPFDNISGIHEKSEPKSIKNINNLNQDELEELSNALRIENMQIKEENRQIKQEILQINRSIPKTKL